MAALSALNTLNGNTNSLGKSLKKVSSGERINNAGDDASGYSISEKMKSQIRALGQCDQNTKTAHSMLNIASEAVNQQVEIMRKVYTIALKASDDTYTDFDRAILQKELNQLHTEIEDIAQETTYNGRYLLNVGSFEKTTFDSQGPFTKNDPPVMSPLSKNDQGGGTGYISGYLPYNGNRNIPAWRQSPFGKYVPNNNSAGTLQKVDSMPGSHLPGYIDTTNYSTYADMEMDFSSLGSMKVPEDIDGKGVSIACNECKQFIAIQFDATKSSSKFIVDNSGGGYGSGCYVIGVKNVSSSADLAKAIFNGVCQARGVGTRVPCGSDVEVPIESTRRHGTRLKYNNATGVLSVIKDNSGLWFCDGVIGTVTKPSDPKQTLYVQGDVKQSQATTVFSPRTTLDALYDGGGWEPTPENPEPDPNFSDCVSTREKASSFLSRASDAIEILLNGNTMLGAELSRLEYMSSNLTTAHESTTNAESVIRDSDMAKEMAEYTKNNILSQAAQSMLAQANQNSSNVLSLLQ